MTGRREWHLDPKIPIAIIAGFILQTLALGWWASKLDSRIGTLETNDQRNEVTVAARARTIDEKFVRLDADRDRLVRLEADSSYIKDTLRRIENKLDAPPRAP